MPYKLYVVISLDVEEEGLFSGKYERKKPGVENINFLPCLEPIMGEEGLGFPLTLLCSYAVFENKKARRTLDRMRAHGQVEIGAHLHHWSTPPLNENGNKGKPERTHILDSRLFRQRLQNLLKIGSEYAGRPLTSFRMGRWDLKAGLLPLLAEHGILVDSSICPLRAFPEGPNHFMAPDQPYWVDFDLPNDSQNAGHILEAPITQLAVSQTLARIWNFQTRHDRLDLYHFFGAVSANPFWHDEKIMRLATKLLTRRGGQILNLFWHSSELMPGGSPHVPNQAAAQQYLSKIINFCKWLKKNYEVRGLTMSQLCDPVFNFTHHGLDSRRDW